MADVTLRNISPMGALDIPIARIIVEAGDTFTVSQEIADLLIPQAENYELVSPKRTRTNTRAAEPNADGSAPADAPALDASAPTDVPPAAEAAQTGEAA